MGTRRLDWLTVKIPFADTEDPDDGDGGSDALHSDDVRLCKWWNSIRPSFYRQFHPSKSEGHSLYSECIYMDRKEERNSPALKCFQIISSANNNYLCILKIDSDTWRENITSSANKSGRIVYYICWFSCQWWFGFLKYFL